jgi:3-deoxy-D-manno-octulosonate 8-phosphate phosphatase (KDO 8-P phosphatase)
VSREKIRKPKSEIRNRGERTVPSAVIRRARAIRMLVLDVDGVLTDGRLFYGPGGQESVAFHILDGHGIKMAIRSGLTLAIVTGRESEAVAQRMRELGVVELHQKAVDKLAVFQDLLGKSGLDVSQVACMGDDLLDLPLLRRAGLAIAVPDAVDEVRAAAHYVTSRRGGRGAVREAVELLLKSQNLWAGEMERYRR